jgi:hypothetical protein
MLGIEDPWIWGGYVLCLLSAGACVVYGVLYWNRNGETPPDPGDTEWDREEQEIDEAL